MTRISLTRLLAAVLIVGAFAQTGQAAFADDSPEYKDYKAPDSNQLYFELVYGHDVLEVIIPWTPAPKRYTFDRDALTVEADAVLADGKVLFDPQGLKIGGDVIPLGEITESSVRDSGDETVISFYTRSESDRRLSRRRVGNLIEPFAKTLVVDDTAFVRGLVLTVVGDIEVYGETGEDVISLFGNVFVSPGAKVRGDIVSFTGRCDIARDASVYGEVFSGKDGYRGRKHRFHREENLTFASTAFYDRVDGITPYLSLRYEDTDSLIPTVWGMAGYAFESEKWRYEAGFEQLFFKSRPLVAGGSVYRRLQSEDEWLLSREENNAFAMIACEDFMDYYQAEGGEAHVRFHPLKDMHVQLGYRYEETRWLDAERDLWSLFGKDKNFGYNFGSVPEARRALGIKEIDSTANGALVGRFVWDTRDTSSPYDYSAWAVRGDFEWSDSGLESDFEYRRYQLAATRYQRFNRSLMLIVRGVYGASDGYLPMQKQFFLGGLGTLPGYKHKEYMGSRFWMANVEYRLSFPRTDLAAGLTWDIGQISAGTRFSAEDEVKNSLGMSLYLGDDVKLSLAKRFDRSDNDDPKFYVRLTHSI